MNKDGRIYVLMQASENGECIRASSHATMAEAETELERQINEKYALAGDTAPYKCWSGPCVALKCKSDAFFWRICAADNGSWYTLKADMKGHALYMMEHSSEKEAMATIQASAQKELTPDTVCMDSGNRPGMMHIIGEEGTLSIHQLFHAALGSGYCLEPRAFLEAKRGSRSMRAFLDDPDGLRTLALELCKNGTPDEMSVGMQQYGTDITATVQPEEKEYPSITVDGHDAANGTYWLGEFELPCGEYPDRFTARLYAGSEKDETDEPIALVSHDVPARREPIPDGEPFKKKLIYVDYRIADTRSWDGPSQDDNPEHR